MERNMEIENEPPSKRQKLETDVKESQDSGLSFPSEQSGSISIPSLATEKDEAPPCLEDENEVDEVDQSVIDLDTSSGSGSEDEDESEDSIIESSEVENKADSIEESESSALKGEENKAENNSATGSSIKSTSLRNKKKHSATKTKSLKSVNKAGPSGSKKAANLRKNIKDILKTEHLGEETLAAQREEAERRQRMNLKLQQQQLKFLHQQQALLMKDSAVEIPSAQNGYTGLSIQDIVKKIAQRKHITVSIDSEDGRVTTAKSLDHSVVQNQEFPCPVSDEIVLSSDDENSSAPQIESTTGETFSAEPNSQNIFQRRMFGHFGGTVMAPINSVQENVISISSGEEEGNDDLLCDKEVESLEESRNNRIPCKAETVDSDDDCVVISPPPEDDEVDRDEKNQDELNVPDEFGRVLVNVGHPEEDPDIFLAPQVAKVVKPHQIGGIRFLYDNVVESVERFNTSSGFGCILAHSMGLGKTIQAVSFCDVFLRASKAKTVLIIVPINTIQNWLNEFNVWLPTRGSDKVANDKALKTKSRNARSVNKTESNSHHSPSQLLMNDSISETMSLNLSFDSTLNLSPELQSEEFLPSKNGKPSSSKEAKEDSENDMEDIGEIHSRTFDVFVLNETVKTLPAREKIITEWANKGGVLLIGYEMYRMLALKKLKRSTRKQQLLSMGDGGETQSLNQIHTCLVNPGPDLVICDEGHRIKNSGASISQALKAIRTRRRVVLTGYPLQNNLMEYWCMVDFIRPNYLGSKVEFSNMFERPISNGQCLDSTSDDRKIMKFRSHVLHSLLEGFVQRRSHAVLQNALPDKQEWVFLLKMTPIQYKLYKEFIRYLSENLEGQSAANPIKAFAVCCKIWNHPDALYNVVKKKQSILDDLDLDEVNAPESSRKAAGGRGSKAKKEQQEVPASQISYFDGNGFNFPQSHYGSYSGATKPASENALSLDWAIPVFQNYKPGILENGVKFEILFEIIKETVAVKDKLLVFSQSLLSLDLVEIFLAQKFQWAKNSQYYRLDGSTTGLERERLINNFNVKPDVCVFLVSTRAGSLGINLTGANRVVVLDASWNPCHDCQAVCRIYRYGQIKPCQIYRFVSDCTLEKRIYDRQINKRGMSDRVVDEMNPNAQFKTKDVSSFLVLQHEHLDNLPYIRWDLKPEKYNSDEALKNVLLRVGNKLTQEPFEHESLLIDQKSQRLSATEKRLAHRQYLNEKRTASLQAASGYSYNRPSYAAYYPKDDVQTSKQRTSYSHSSVGSTSTNYRQYQLTNDDKFEQHLAAFRAKGICVQHIVLKKDSFLTDPSGGPDMFLMAGEKIYVLRSEKGTYLRITNGKLMGMKNNANYSRLPGMNIPPSQELSKEQLQGLIYSFLKVPGQPTFNLDSYGSSSCPPTEQALPPSPSFFSQSKNHLQVTNARNNSGGDVTMWQPQGKVMSFDESVNGTPGGLKLSSSANSNSSSFNPNLERLSYLANRFPGFVQGSEGYHGRSKSSQGYEQTRYPSPSYSGSPFPSNNLLGNSAVVSGERAEVELIPIRKSSSRSGRSSLRTNSRPGSPSNSQNNESHSRKPMSLFDSLLPNSSRPIFDFSSSSYQEPAIRHPATPPTSAQNVLDLNPSFYNDFTITVKSTNNSNGSSSNSNGSELYANNSGQQSLPSSRGTARTRESSQSATSSSPWLNKLLFTDSSSMQMNNSTTVESEQASKFRNLLSFPNNQNVCPNLFPQFDFASEADGNINTSTSGNNESTNSGAVDFRNSSQYYSSNNLMSGSGSQSSLPSGLAEQSPSSRNDNMPVYFPNQGV